MLPLIVKTEGDRKRMLMKQAFEVDYLHGQEERRSDGEPRRSIATIASLEATV